MCWRKKACFLYLDDTRRWLAENFKKGLVYIPARMFMETAVCRYNGPIGPAGYSMAHLTIVSVVSDGGDRSNEVNKKLDFSVEN